ncbi:obscurin-like isoform X2 [Dreissena polymorpha]|uniref:Ig-like domain-containing protein n=1 Tax=Dreissena polymorpha TaxID=45954 RepID=A0A9D4I2C0_DREPO|nr:obscurin-like isoform X2 [Dreissena polymorpha]KAH3741669.1 hypothetical protein DPMN_048394 [Dreissena polymorpha]
MCSEMGIVYVPNRVMKSVLLTLSIIGYLQIGASNILQTDDDNGEPYFLKAPTNITVREGDLAKLKCRIANLGPKMVVWRKTNDDYPLTIGEMSFSQDDEMSIDHSQITKTSSTWDLLIKNVKPRHAGMYECQISANHLIAHYVTLNVVDKSEMRPGKQTPMLAIDAINFETELRIIGNAYVNMGGVIHLICNATGAYRAPEAVDWFYDGNRIHTADERWKGRVEIVRHESFEGKYYVSELIIDKSRLEDNGDYVCRSSDLAVNSVKIHILNTEKDNLTRRGSGKDAQSESIRTDPDSGSFRIHTQAFPVMAFAILPLVCRYIFIN